MLTTLLSTTVIATVLSFTPQNLWDAWPEERFVTTAAPCLRPAELEESLRALARRHGERLRLEEVGPKTVSSRSGESATESAFRIGRGRAHRGQGQDLATGEGDLSLASLRQAGEYLDRLDLRSG